MLFPPQQLEYLKQAFIRSVGETISGASLQTGTLPPNRLSGPVPPALLQEADPVALPIAQAAQAAVADATADAQGAVEGVEALTGQVTDLEGRATTLEGQATALGGRATDLEDVLEGGHTGTYNIVVEGDTRAFVFEDGILKSAEVVP